jgi:stage II sporulation protein D
MGPELYGQLEALKAQTVAARTYAVRNLGEFREEGFDICSTPRCQVYGGMAVEHPLSDRAIAETAHQVVLFDGSPAETFYGDTCGGHNENVEVVFPLKTGAYLRGVPCLEAGVGRIQGDVAAGAPFPAALTRRLLPSSAERPDRDLAARLVHLARLAGLSVPRDRLESTHRKEVMRFVISIYDLALDRRLRPSREHLERLLDDPPPEWRRSDRELAAYLVASPLLAEPGDRPVSAAQAEELLFHLAEYLGVVEHRRVRYLALAQGRLEVRGDSGRQAYDLPDSLATFRPRGDALRAGPLELMAGDELDLYLHGGRLAALVQPVAVAPVHFGDRAPKQSWSRFVSAEKLKSAVQKRYPGFPFEDFEVLSRGVSGRVGKLKLLGEGGRSLVVEGLAVRWTLGVWDTLFWAQPYDGGGGGPGWLFRGKGWGHGVGMCQAGAYGMAVRGASYRAILEHYYTGIELGRLKPVRQRPRLATAGIRSGSSPLSPGSPPAPRPAGR